MFKVKATYLLLIASVVWMVAGFNVLRIGVISYEGNVTILNIVISAVIFYLFWFKVFNKLVNKNTYRIKSYKNQVQYFWKFFERKSFIIMAFMIFLGVTIRVFNLVPVEWIAVFYVGLGTALSLAGIKFLYYYLFSTTLN